MTNVVQFAVAKSVSQKLKVIRAELEPVIDAVSYVMGWIPDPVLVVQRSHAAAEEVA